MTRSVRLALVVFLLPLAGLAAVTPPVAKVETSPGPKKEEAYFEAVSVTVVNLDVYVLDKAGHRVPGLGVGDFQVFEDGRPVQITNFYVVESGKASVEPVVAASPGTPAAPAPVPAPLGTRAEEQQLSLIVYVDNFNLRPFNRNRVLRELREFLTQNTRPGDRVMLVTYDRERHVRVPFTTDAAAVAAATFQLEKISAQGVHLDSDRREMLRSIDDAKSVGDVYGRVRAYAESQYNDLSFTVTALKDFVSSLAGLPGRKALLYVSDGLQMHAGEDMYYAMQEKWGQQVSLLEAMTYDMSRPFQELSAEANANRVTFYTIDAAGLRVGSDASAENATPRSSYVDQIFTSNMQAPLQMLAADTGGQSVLNTNSVLPALQRIAADFDTYYSLGYTPSHAGDGRYHKLEVRLKKKGLTIRHRDGYRDKTPESRAADLTLSALIFGFETNPLGVEIEFGRAARREDGNYLLPVLVKIPLGKVALVPREGGERAQLRIYVAVQDSQGGTTPVQETPVLVDIPTEKVKLAQQQYYVYELKLLMAPGEQVMALTVRDDLGASSSLLRRALTVGD